MEIFQNNKIVVEAAETRCISLSLNELTDDVVNDNGRIAEIYLGVGARLDLNITHTEPSGSESEFRIIVRQKASSRFNLFLGLLNPGQVAGHVEVHLDEEGSEARLDGLAILDGEQRAQCRTRVHHHAPHCHSDQLFKYVVSDRARGVFDGLIRVDHGAVGTEAYQNNRNILVGEKARMHTEPQLEIYCDDVKCSHGAATGQLDESALFYMETRGIDRDTARSMLVNAFAADVIDRIGDEPLRNLLKDMTCRRLGWMPDNDLTNE